MLYIILSFIAFILFNNYLFVNIQGIGNTHHIGSLAMGVLFLSIIIFMLLIFWQTITSKHFYIRKSFLIIILYFVYFTLSIIVDIDSVEELRQLTIATTAGVIFFYVIGAMIGILLFRIKTITLQSKLCAKVLFIMFVIYLLSHTYFIFSTFTGFSENVRLDRFLLSDAGSYYQRPGNFLIISSMILSLLYISTLLLGLLNFKNSFRLRLLRIVCFSLYAINLLMAMLIAQLMGSNNALICISGMLILIIVFHIFLLRPSIKMILNEQTIKLKNIVAGRIFTKIFNSIIIGVISFAAILIFAIVYMEIDLSMFRITGFGTGEVSSVNSRAEILSSFPEQFFHSFLNPFFGNMQVHILTDNLFVHSFLLSVLTHLGIVGFIIIVYYYYLAIKELFQQDIIPNVYTNGIKIYKLLLFLGIFLVANSAVFLNWPPLWFLMGILFIPISFGKNYKLQYDERGT